MISQWLGLASALMMTCSEVVFPHLLLPAKPLGMRLWSRGVLDFSLVLRGSGFFEDRVGSAG